MPPASLDSSTREVRRSIKAPAAVFFMSCSVYLLTFAHFAISPDVYGSNWTAWRLATTGSPYIDGAKLDGVSQALRGHMLIIQTPEGHTVFGRFPGVVAASLPAYFASGSNSFSEVPGDLTAAILTAVTVTLMFAALRPRLRTWQAALAAGVFGFATPVWSVAANQMWPHTITLLGIAGMAWASSTGRWWWVGVFGGLTLWGRLHASVIVAVLGLGVALRRRDPWIAVRVATMSGLFLVALSCWIRWMYGTWNPLGPYPSTAVGQNADRYRFDIVNQLGMWVAPDRGILVWTPVILLLLPALARSWPALPDWSRSLVYGGLVYTVLGCALNTFTGGSDFYGYRYGLEMLACAVPALAMSAPAMGRSARLLMWPLLGVQFLAIALGSVNDGNGLADWFSWKKNAFISQVVILGSPGWALVAASALLGWALGLFVERRLERTRTDVSGTAADADTTVGQPSMNQA